MISRDVPVVTMTYDSMEAAETALKLAGYRRWPRSRTWYDLDGRKALVSREGEFVVAYVVEDSEVPGAEEVLYRWPRVVAHLICESLGYFTPTAAARAILAAKKGEPFYCEWYNHIASSHGPFDDENQWRDKMVEITRRVLSTSIENRRYHNGYMSDFSLAMDLIKKELEGRGPLFSSWF